MNILHMRYAVEVARLGSLNKAAETLLIAQPNISRSIKELEKDLGIVIFSRSAKGMTLTPDGKEFIGYAKGILRQIDNVEQLYKGGAPKKQKFSLYAPRAHYVSQALAEFSDHGADRPTEILYREADAEQTLQAVLSDECKLGIIRYAEEQERYLQATLVQKGLCSKPVATFTYRLTMSSRHPLAQKKEIEPSALSPFAEIAHADAYLPSLSPKATDVMPAYHTERRIIAPDRAAQLALLLGDPSTFTWAAPVCKEELDRYGLVQRVCTENDRCFRDVLIYRDTYKLTRSDKQFLAALNDAKRRHF